MQPHQQFEPPPKIGEWSQGFSDRLVNVPSARPGICSRFASCHAWERRGPRSSTRTRALGGARFR